MTTARERTLAVKGKASSELPLVRVRGEGFDVIVDAATFTGRERGVMKAALQGLGYQPDEEDATFAAIWVVMRRNDPSLKFDWVLDNLTLGDLADAEKVDVSEDDSPEV